MIMMDMIMYVYEENNNSNIDRSEEKEDTVGTIYYKGIPKDTCPTKVKRENSLKQKLDAQSYQFSLDEKVLPMTFIL
ncbi:22064_t:CDS:2 [Entrophospora sp. SA101]|nr:14465_t:CDS:2 [Entrophospora sp. SA101]CAJ0766106.1 22064_t:CDS:2 [Entrophospora sp. SA101]